MKWVIRAKMRPQTVVSVKNTLGNPAIAARVEVYIGERGGFEGGNDGGEAFVIPINPAKMGSTNSDGDMYISCDAPPDPRSVLLFKIDYQGGVYYRWLFANDFVMATHRSEERILYTVRL